MRQESGKKLDELGASWCCEGIEVVPPPLTGGAKVKCSVIAQTLHHRALVDCSFKHY